MRSDGNLVVGGGGGSRALCLADLSGQRLPLPKVIEDDSEAGWSLWDTSVESQWPGAGGPPAFVLRQRPLAFIPAGHPLTIDPVLAVARVHNRVCPMPARWLLLHDLLTLGGARRHTPLAPPPLCGRAWTSTSAITKRVRMREQITWAADYGGLRDVYDWLLGLDEGDWLHFGQ